MLQLYIIKYTSTVLPCLYLGTTSYVCWLELGRPADHEFNVSPVQLDNTQRVFKVKETGRNFKSE